MFRDMTAVLLSKLLTREDMREGMQDVLQWCWCTLAETDATNNISRYDTAADAVKRTGFFG